MAAHAVVIDPGGPVTYAQLWRRSSAVAQRLRGLVQRDAAGRQPRVAHLCPRDSSYVVAQWASWHAVASGAINVPLADKTPRAELEYVLRDSAPSVLIADASTEVQATALADALGIACVTVDGRQEAEAAAPTAVPGDSGALIIYTSGTTGKPKGVVHTHSSLEAQIRALAQTWRWTADDRILNVLPLHHVHGIVNVVACALYSGATVEMHPGFDPARVWDALQRPTDPLSLFMAVPTVYVKLIEHFEALPDAEREHLAREVRAQHHMRLMVSGSAALPLSVLRRWKEITGFHLLERYGMTEFGMALSNRIGTDSDDSSVGWPLPGVTCRLVGEDTGAVLTDAEATGELHVKGSNMFREYLNRPDATAESFTPDGWFRTGDQASRGADGKYYIRGRLSMDIIKSGGFKLSALEIERVLLEHPAIAECIVLGVPDAVYGERVVAVVVPRPAAVPHLDASAWDNRDLLLSSPPSADDEHLRAIFDLREWARDRLAPYKTPSRVRLVREIPRNAMGKVNKKSIREQL